MVNLGINTRKDWCSNFVGKNDFLKVKKIQKVEKTLPKDIKSTIFRIFECRTNVIKTS